MSLAKIRYLSSVLSKKYGVVGRVASKYLEAGFRVKFLEKKGAESVADFIAYKKDKFIVKVVYSKHPSEDAIKKLAEVAVKHGARPVLVLYGRVKPLSDSARRAIEENNIVLKRVR